MKRVKIYRNRHLVMVSKHQKIRINQGKLPNKVFSVKFTCEQPFLILAYVFYIKIMASGNLPPQMREVVIRGGGNCFYRAIALWYDEVSDEKHEEIRRLSSSLIERNPKVFEPLLFSSNSVMIISKTARSQELGLAEKIV